VSTFQSLEDYHLLNLVSAHSHAAIHCYLIFSSIQISENSNFILGGEINIKEYLLLFQALKENQIQ